MASSGRLHLQKLRTVAAAHADLGGAACAVLGSSAYHNVVTRPAVELGTTDAGRGKAVRKVSRQGLAYVMARRLDGATTVSATMLLAHRAGIHVFVTGGEGARLPVVQWTPLVWCYVLRVTLGGDK